MVTHFEPSYKVIKIFKDSCVPLKNVPITTNVEFITTKDEFKPVEYDFLKQTPKKSIEQLKDTKQVRSYILTIASIIFTIYFVSFIYILYFNQFSINIT